MMTNTMIHMFEKAGLGQAPYTFDGVETTHGSTCQFCGTAIIYRFWLTSADGRKFFVGSDCILKSGDAGLKRIIDPILAAHQAELRENREREVLAKFAEYSAATPNFWNVAYPGEHPYKYFASIGKTKGDYMKFCYDHSGRAKRAKIAREVLVNAGILSARKKKSA